MQPSAVKICVSFALLMISFCHALCNGNENTLSLIENGNPGRGRRIYVQRFQQFYNCRLQPGATSDYQLEYLFLFLVNPKKYNPSTKLVFAGIKKKRERADFLAYLRQSGKSMPCLWD